MRSAINPGQDISNAEAGGYLVLGFLALGIVVFVIYEVYEFGLSANDALKKLFCNLTPGCDPNNMTASNSSAGNTYTNAANQMATDPIGSWSSILGFNQTAPAVGSTTLTNDNGANMQFDSTSVGNF